MTRLELYQRDARLIRRLALEIERQVGHYERNTEKEGEAEALRFLLIRDLASDLLKVARRGANRYWKERP